MPDAAVVMQEHAEAHLSGPVELVTVLGTEDPDFSMDDEQDCGVFEPDRRFGDGVARVWLYVFSNGTEATTVVADASESFRCLREGVVRDPLLPRLPGKAGRVTEWQVNASQAVQALSEQAPAYGNIAERCPVTMSLFQFAGGPGWTFTAVEPASEQLRSWVVHADNGSLLPDAPGHQQPATCTFPPEQGEATGTAPDRLLDPEGEAAEFTLNHSHGALAFSVVSQDPAAQEGFIYDGVILYPNGAELEFTTRNGAKLEPGPGLRGEYQVRIESDTPGTHTFTVSYETGG